MSNSSLRVLAAYRLSDDKDNSTSIERQRQHVNGWAAMHDAVVVAEAEDVDVSGAVPAFDRPELGKWLARPDQWDVLVGYRVDRIGRDLHDVLGLVKWAKTHGKAVVSTSESIDTRDGSVSGKILLTVLGMVGELERDATSARVKDSRRLAKEQHRYHGGRAPYGWRPVKLAPPAKGWRYEVDPEQAEVIHTVVKLVIDGDSLNSVAAALNDAGVPTALAAHRARVKKDNPTPNKWAVSALQAILKPHLLGDDRLPAILEPGEWKVVEGALAALARGPRAPRARRATPLGGLAFCHCGAPLYRQILPNQRDRYRCSAKTGCKVSSIVANDLHDAVSAFVEHEFHFHRMMRRVVIPGSDNAAELSQVGRAINRMRDDRDAGLYPDDNEYAGRMRGLLARQAELASHPCTPERVELVPTGETFGEAWRMAEAGDVLRGGRAMGAAASADGVEDWTERRELLLKTGLRFTVLGSGAEMAEGEFFAVAAKKPRVIRIVRAAEPAFELGEPAFAAE